MIALPYLSHIILTLVDASAQRSLHLRTLQRIRCQSTTLIGSRRLYPRSIGFRSNVAIDLQLFRRY
jgi:hypothetical protein